MYSPSLWSDVEQLSMNVCATTDRHESTIFDLWMSKTKFGFLIRLTQNLSGRELLFHVCTTSGSDIPWWRAWSSRKSNMYLIASGSADPRWAVLNIVSNRSSTNFCSVPLVASNLVRYISDTILLPRSPSFWASVSWCLTRCQLLRPPSWSWFRGDVARDSGGLAELNLLRFRVSYLCDLSVFSDSIERLYIDDDCFETRFRAAPSGTL